jgi:hypothetical protein
MGKVNENSSCVSRQRRQQDMLIGQGPPIFYRYSVLKNIYIQSVQYFY